jgi:hypothetical protein
MTSPEACSQRTAGMPAPAENHDAKLKSALRAGAPRLPALGPGGVPDGSDVRRSAEELLEDRGRPGRDAPFGEELCTYLNCGCG